MNTTGKDNSELGVLRSLVYACGEFGGNIVNLVFGGWVLYFYTDTDRTGHDEPLVSMAIMTAILVGGRIVDAIADPLVGYFSDNTKTRIGRRRPYIIGGAPLLAFTFILLFRPFSPAGSWAMVAETALKIGLFWIFFTVVMGPYLSLMPELAITTQQRVRLNIYTAVGMLMATGYQMIAVSKMVDKDAMNLGYFNMSVVSAAISMVFLLIVGFGIRERPAKLMSGATEDKTPGGEDNYNFFDAIKWTFGNPAFAIYILSQVAFKLGFASLMASIPFIVTRLMGKTESFVANVAFVSVPGFLVSFVIINALTKKTGKVALYKFCLLLLSLIMPMLYFIGQVELPVNAATAGMIMIGLMSFPIAGDMLLPKAILADITDFDAKRTGHRREGMYFGVQGLVQKFSTSVSKAMSGALFAMFGYSMQNHLGVNLLGPVAGLCGFIGFLIFLKFPLSDRPGAEKTA